MSHHEIIKADFFEVFTFIRQQFFPGLLLYNEEMTRYDWDSESLVSRKLTFSTKYRILKSVYHKANRKYSQAKKQERQKEHLALQSDRALLGGHLEPMVHFLP